jgi:hypothetical protein
LSVEPVQASITEFSVAATWCTPLGAEGGVASGQAAVDTVVEVTGEWRSPRSNASTPTV